MQAQFLQDGESIDYTPSSAVAVGDVVVIGTIPLVATRPIDANALGSLNTEGVFDVVKTTDTFSAGDAVYWKASADPVGGSAGTGAAQSSATAANLMGLAVLAALTGDTTVRVKITAAKRTTAIAGSVTADDVTGSDSTLTITGAVGSSSAGGTVTVAGGAGNGSANAGGAVSMTGGTGAAAGAGGAASVVGGVPTSGNAAGGAATFSGGAGSGTGAGGAVTSKGGASGTGATGNGGAYTAGGGAALSTNGTGGAASLSGGVATGTGTGGALTLAAGASAGASGTAGAVSIDAGAAAGGTAASITLGTNAKDIVVASPVTVTPGGSTAAAGSTTSDAGVLPAATSSVYPTTAADDTKGVRVHANDKVTGRTLFIGNGVSNKILKVYGPSGAVINGGSADAAFSSASGKGVIIVCLSGAGNTWLAW